MGRKRKNSEELARPRAVIAPVQPVNTRPRRSTKDAFYNKLSTLTSTRKSPIEDEEEFVEEKPKVVKNKEVVSRKASSSSNEAAPTRVIMVKPKAPVLQDQLSEAEPPKKKLVKVETPQAQPKTAVTAVQLPLPKLSAPPQQSNGLHFFLGELRKPHLSLGRLNIDSLSVDPRMQFNCKLCSRRFQFPIEYEMHMKSHVENTSSCALCEKPPAPLTLDEYIEHLGSHFIAERNQTTCIFCGEMNNGKSPAELAQHLLYYCPSVRYCFLCEAELSENSAREHRRQKHAKLLNRYVCSTCFLGFPSLSPFLHHICQMRYRCLCEMTDVYEDHHSVNKHIDECEKFELQYHGILIPDTCGRKRCFFVNPHSVMPRHQNIPSTYGFRNMDYTVPQQNEEVHYVQRGARPFQPFPGNVVRGRMIKHLNGTDLLKF